MKLKYLISFFLLLNTILYSQPINIVVKIKNTQPISFIDPLTLEVEVVNNTQDTIILPHLFFCNTTKFKYWEINKSDTSFIYNKGSDDFSNMFDIVLPYQNYRCFQMNNYRYFLFFTNWDKKTFLLKDKNKKYKAQLEVTFFINNKKITLVSNFFDFSLKQLSKNDRRILKKINSYGNSFDYIYAVGKKEKFDEILDNCNNLLKNYKSQKFTPYILRTISMVYEVYLMEEDFNAEASSKRNEILEKAEVHFNKLLQIPNLTNFQKVEIGKYHQGYKKRLENNAKVLD